MRRQSYRGLVLRILSCFVLLDFYAESQQSIYPYTNGQAVFVQSPYNSSLYTNYNFNPYESAPQRLPAYTTNQAVFVQQPYATTQQTVTSYPSNYRDTLPYTENRYSSPAAYPSTVAPAYPYANSGLYPTSPYTTTNQNTTYRYPYSGVDYTEKYTYPYTTSTQTMPYPPPAIERVPAGGYAPGESPQAYAYQRANQSYVNSYPENASKAFPSTTYEAYPISTRNQYPYPTTSTAVPEMVVQPIPANSAPNMNDRKYASYPDRP